MKHKWTKRDEEALEEYKTLDRYYRDRTKLFIEYCALQQEVLKDFIQDPRRVDHEKTGIICCSFCGKSKGRVKKMVAGPSGAYICDECLSICNEIMEEEFQE